MHYSNGFNVPLQLDHAEQGFRKYIYLSFYFWFFLEIHLSLTKISCTKATMQLDTRKRQTFQKFTKDHKLPVSLVYDATSVIRPTIRFRMDFVI